MNMVASDEEVVLRFKEKPKDTIMGFKERKGQLRPGDIGDLTGVRNIRQEISKWTHPLHRRKYGNETLTHF